MKQQLSFLNAYRIDDNTIELKYKGHIIEDLNFIIYEYNTYNVLEIKDKILHKETHEIIFHTETMKDDINYEIHISNENINTKSYVLWSDHAFSKFKSEKTLGLTKEENNYVFRIFAPRAKKVILSLFKTTYKPDFNTKKYDNETQFLMTKDNNGIWEYFLSDNEISNYKYYGYRISGPEGFKEMFNDNIIICDPYSKAIIKYMDSPQFHLSIINPPEYYEFKYPNPQYEADELIIYECHLRDMTMLCPDNPLKGTYKGFVENTNYGGLNHIKNLGVNAIEFLPIHEFNEIEAPFMESFNTWNVYGRNHWGYMTTCYFAPSTYYDTTTIKYSSWMGEEHTPIISFKYMIDHIHKHNIAVIMDVVYNHVSQYDNNPLKYIDKYYYFWIDNNGNFESKSGCGNDFKTDRYMARRIIIDSLKYFAKEFKVDGFRFDLGTIIDWETYNLLREELKKINPYIFLVAEPWMGGRGGERDGGDYSPEGMARHQISSWNDKTREIIRGHDGLVYGRAEIEKLINAVKVFPEIFIETKYSLNYIESHDNNTFSDYLRLRNHTIKENEPIDREEYIYLNYLSEKELRQNQIAALFLLTIKGPIMIHAGQEFGRMQICFPPDNISGFSKNKINWILNNEGIWENNGHKWPEYKVKPYCIEHDNYEKDNESNWINWNILDLNKELYNYYKDLIEFRKEVKCFKNYPIDKIEFIIPHTEKNKDMKSSIGYIYYKEFLNYHYDVGVFINGDMHHNAIFNLPEGEWFIKKLNDTIVRQDRFKFKNNLELKPLSGILILRK